MIWPILIQFVFRLTFGIAVSMAVTPARLVTSGFYRVHLWVLMGLNTFAALVVFSSPLRLDDRAASLTLAIVLAVVSYIGAVLWLYDAKRFGVIALWLVAGLAVTAALLATPWKAATGGGGCTLAALNVLSGGMLLGLTITAMFLGHWYLNAPGMQLVPLKRLVLGMAAVAIARMLISGIGAGLHISAATELATSFWIFLAFRWLTGLLGLLLMAKLTWETLKIPNTQSATGILYAGVILAFLGELSSQLLSVETRFPV